VRKYQKEVVPLAYACHLCNCFGRKVHGLGVKMEPHDQYIVLLWLWARIPSVS
jgi:hypothetical protein